MRYIDTHIQYVRAFQKVARLRVCVRVFVCVCLCVCVREKERERASVCICVRARTRACRQVWEGHTDSRPESL